MKTTRALVLAGLAVVILFFPQRALQLVGLLTLAVFAASYLYSRLLARYVVVRRQNRVLRAHRLEPLEIALVIENHSPLPAHYLSLVDPQNHFFATPPGRFLVPLSAYERRQLRYRLESQTRGEYTIGPVLLQGADPLGLFPWTRRLGGAQTLYVYPEVLPIAVPTRSGLPAGNIPVASRIYEDPTRYRSVREYSPGDDPKRIQWKVSARLGALHSVDYLPELYAPVLVLLNLRGEDYPLRYRHHRIERAAIVAASLVVHYVRLRQEIGFLAAARLRGSDRPPMARIRGTAGHATGILELLARVEPGSGEEEFARLLQTSGLRVPYQTRIQAITPVVSPESRRILRSYRRRGCTVEIFLMGAEEAERRELSREFSVYAVADYGRELLLA